MRKKSRGKARQSRYEAFTKFADSADSYFNDLRNCNKRAQEFHDTHTFYAVKGGAYGGVDKRIVEVFFGKRPIDSALTFEPDNMFAGPKVVLVMEQGAHLLYERTDIGSVLCTLYPAKTEALRQREDFLVLQRIRNPRWLNTNWIRKCHWRAFMSYMECTSVDGEPSLMDRMRVGYLRLMCPLVTGDRVSKRSIATGAQKLISFALTVGLSGFLLLAITRWFNVRGGHC